MAWLHRLWAIPALWLIAVALAILPKPRARQGSGRVGASGHPVEPCDGHGWRALLHPLEL